MERSHCVVPSTKSGIFVPNVLNMLNIGNHMLFVSPPVLTQGTDVDGVLMEMRETSDGSE